ncbi:hypothetical protein AGR8A_pAt30050 [Agrobacterium fabrum str. J-07]|nr:hypothetical protein AGR8A_pAt30050 [Agrobacterium fabrum str. J-07]
MDASVAGADVCPFDARVAIAVFSIWHAVSGRAALEISGIDDHSIIVGRTEARPMTVQLPEASLKRG